MISLRSRKRRVKQNEQCLRNLENTTKSTNIGLMEVLEEEREKGEEK